MQIFELKVSDAIPYENNPRINEHAIEPVKNSIQEFGFKIPVLVNKDNVIITGHTRLMAAKELGMTTVPAIKVEDLSEEQVKAFRLADNKVSEYALWDNEKLIEEIDEIDLDMTELFGFFDEQRFMNLDSIMKQPENIDDFFTDSKSSLKDNGMIKVTLNLKNEEEFSLLENFCNKNKIDYKRV